MPKDTFFAEEYKSLRQEIDAKLKDRLEFNRWGLIGIAGLYSYIFSNPGKPALFWIPVFLSVAMLAHLNEEHRLVCLISEYIKTQYEPWAAGGEKTPVGWETYLKCNRTPRWWLFWRRWPGHLWDWAPVPLWVVVFLFTLFIAHGVSKGSLPSLITPLLAVRKTCLVDADHALSRLRPVSA
jgi:hypothetical protein